MLKKGQKVKCIDNQFKDKSTNPFRISQLILPIKDKEYTIRQVVKTEYGGGILLNEIKNDKFYLNNTKKYEEPLFNIKRFEPLDKPNSNKSNS